MIGARNGGREIAANCGEFWAHWDRKSGFGPNESPIGLPEACTEAAIFIVAVKKADIENIGGRGVEAGRVLYLDPAFTIVGLEGRAADGLTHAVVRFAGTEAEVAVVQRGRANAATAWQLVHEASVDPDTPLLLIADEATAQARAILSEHGVAVVDRLGNAHVELPGLLLRIEGGGRRARRAPPARLIGKAGVVAQALLLDPEREWQVKDLAERTGVSSGLAHRVLARLDREGVTSAEGAGPQRVRRVTNPTALLDLWVEEDDPRPARLPAHILAQTPGQLIEKLAGNLKDGGIDYALTGAGAAGILAPFVTAVPVLAVWVTANVLPDELFAAAGVEQAQEGANVVFLQAKDDAPLAFAERQENVRLANRFRVYADLLDDPRRGPEQAKHLRSEAIGF